MKGTVSLVIVVPPGHAKGRGDRKKPSDFTLGLGSKDVQPPN